jgi:hypothetical protein
MDLCFQFCKVASKDVNDKVCGGTLKKRKFCSCIVHKDQASLVLEVILPQQEGKDCRKGFGFKNYLLLTLLPQSCPNFFTGKEKNLA